MQPRTLIDFLAKIEKLKCNTRHCWTSSGRQESVADHSWRLAVLALLVAGEFPDVDIDKVVRMCLIHDFGEAVTGDIPSFLKTEKDEINETSAISDLLKLLPHDISHEFSLLFTEMEALNTSEAKLFKALDKIEALLTHNESPLETWLPLEYEENLTYGIDNASYSEYLKLLRDEIKRDTIKKIR